MADPQQQADPQAASPFRNFPTVAQVNAMQPVTSLAAPQQQPSFDVNGARQEGYSDDEILDHLTEQSKFDTQSALKEGYSKQEVINYLAGAPQTSSQTTAAPSPEPPSLLSYPLDYMHGIGAGAARSIPFIGKKIPQAWTQEGVTNPEAEAWGEKAGGIMEPAAEMVAMGGPLKSIFEEGAARFLPWLGRFGAPLARVGAESAGAGISAKLHDQPVGPAAAIGAGGAAASEGLQALAPKMAESVLNITNRLRGRGRTIGPAILEETSGIRPGTIAAQAENQISNLTGQMEQGVHDATLAGAQGSTQPAHDALDQAISSTPRNAPELIDKLKELRTKLGFPFDPANPQKAYTPDELLEMKRGLNTAISHWPPEWQHSSEVQRAAQQLYGALDGELDRLVPSNAELNQRISSLMPARDKALELSQGPGMLGRIATRAVQPTTALLGSALGYRGYRGAGIPGALAAAAAGLVAPELRSPEAQMAMARLMRLGIPSAIAKGIVASGGRLPGEAGQLVESIQQPSTSGK
jgi:hypothetical protein